MNKAYLTGGEGEGVIEDWPKSCDVITFCVNRFWGLFGLSFQVESRILLCSPQVITFRPLFLNYVKQRLTLTIFRILFLHFIK